MNAPNLFKCPKCSSMKFNHTLTEPITIEITKECLCDVLEYGGDTTATYRCATCRAFYCDHEIGHLAEKQQNLKGGD